ncbi:MAG: aspartate aminotransferase family protein [Bacteroidetes bacterium]|nr:MAG: aspartate aminotransferase family protein [Bacteroidota bacterium]
MHLSNRQLYYQHLAVPANVPEALEIVKAEGIYLHTDKGDKYVDLVSGVSVSNIGHRHPKVVEAIKNQVDKYMHLMVYGEFIQSPQVQLAGKLTEKLPSSLDAVFLVNSGSEAIEGAMKLAKRSTKRSEIIAFKNAYHGGTQGALSILGNEEMKYAFRPLLPDIRFLEFNNFDNLSQITKKTAAVVVEAIQAEAGIILPKDGFLKALRKRCDEVSCELILDDIQMGFGRTGKLFSFENYDFIPDIMTIAKGMGGGMPIGAFVSSKEKMNLLQHQPALGHITTFGGHPVSAAAALASLEVLTETDLVEQANAKGKRFADGLINHPKVKEIRQQGLMLAVELKSEEIATEIMPKLFANRLIVDQFLFNRSSFRIAPPLIITIDEIDNIIKAILKSFS